MSDLPVGWTWATIGELCAINPRTFDEPLGDDDELSQVPMAAVKADTGYMDGSRVVRYGDVKRKSLTPFQENDVLFAKVTPCMENGKIALATGLHGGRAVGSTELFALRSLGGINPKYLMYFLLQPRVRKDAEHSMTGAVGLRRVPRPYLEALPLPLPPLAEQRRIVAALEEHLSRLVAGNSSIDRADGYSLDLKRVVEDRAVLGQLVQPDGSEGDGETFLRGLSQQRAAQVGKRRTKAEAPAKYAYTLPSHWTLASVDQLCWNIEYGTSTKTNDDFSGIPVLRMGNIQSGRIDMTKLKYLDQSHPDISSLHLAEGDLLFNRTNSAELVGKSAVYRESLGPATFASYLIRCRFVENIDPDWVNLVINSSIGRTYICSVVSQQVGQANVNGTKLARMPIPIPPLAEQRRILTAVSAQDITATRLTNALEQSRTRSQSLRATLLAAAFSGKLASQDPADESASLLLERIRGASQAKPRLARGSRKLTVVGTQGDLLS